MKRADVEVGGIYEVRVSGQLRRVRLSCLMDDGSWWGINLQTGKRVSGRSCQRLRRRLEVEARSVVERDAWGRDRVVGGHGDVRASDARPETFHSDADPGL